MPISASATAARPIVQLIATADPSLRARSLRVGGALVANGGRGDG